jgi:hypothetical protein
MADHPKPTIPLGDTYSDVTGGQIFVCSISGMVLS